MAGTNGEGGPDADVIVLDEIDLSDAEAAALALEEGDRDFKVVEIAPEDVDPVEAQRALGRVQLKVSALVYGHFDPLKMKASAVEAIEAARKVGVDTKELDLLEDYLQVNIVKGLWARAGRAISVFKEGTREPVFMKATVEKAIEAIREESDDPLVLLDLQVLEQGLEDTTPGVFFKHSERLVVKLESADNPNNKRILEEAAQDAIEVARDNGADPSALQTLITRTDKVMADMADLVTSDDDCNGFIF